MTAEQQSGQLGRYGLIFDAASFDKLPNSKAILRSLTFSYEPNCGPRIVYKNYNKVKQQDGRIVYILPRNIMQEFGNIITTVWPVAFGIRIETSISASYRDFLYTNQQIVINHIMQLWGIHRNDNTVSLNLRAGYGKTYIAAGLIAALNERAPIRCLYIVPTRELAHQTYKDLAPLLEHVVCAHSIAEFTQLCHDHRHICVIVVINTGLRISSNASMHFDLTIFDEVHTYCSKARSKIFNLMQTRFMFGMSATTDERRDGFDEIFKQHLHPLICAETIPNFTYDDVQFTCRVRAIKYNAPERYARNLKHESTGKIFVHYMYEQFASDEKRNALIMDQIDDLVNKGHNIFVFSEERAHLEKLFALYNVKPNATQCAMFYGSIDDEERAHALHKDTRVIFATYSYSGTGISIIRMTAMILATPRYSGMKQIVGRILRRGSDPTIERIIVDIIDKKTALAYQYRLRKNIYDYYGCTNE